MSYGRKLEYIIEPEGSFQILRNCSGCGCKAVFCNTNCFRVNANGNRIDVWMIYQCKKCKHTMNLTIYERCRPDRIPKQEYEGFLNNASELSLQYGRDKRLFEKNKAFIDWSELKYTISGPTPFMQEGETLVINNPYELKLRTDKIVSELLKLTRTDLKKRVKSEIVYVEELKQEHKIIVTI